MIPTRRATGAGLQILMSHLLGDAISPYLIGVAVDEFRKYAIETDNRILNSIESFTVRQHALCIVSLVCALCSLFYFFCSLYVLEDKDMAKGLASRLSRKSLVASTTSANQLYYKNDEYDMELSPTEIAKKAVFNSRASSGYLSNSNLYLGQNHAASSRQSSNTTSPTEGVEYF